MITTPHIPTEVSNLAELSGSERNTFNGVFQQLTGTMDERFQTSREIVGHRTFARLGLTDAAIAMATRRDLLVLTDDLDLYVALAVNGLDCVNFNHIRVL